MATNPVPDRAVIEAWWEWQRLTGATRPERTALATGSPASAWRARRALDEIVAAGRPEAVAWLVALNDAGPAVDDGVTVGCGPLEDLLHEHADMLINEVDQAARRSPGFAQALSHVWLSEGAATAATQARLRTWIRRPNDTHDS